MLETLISVIHIVDAFVLILVVLLQQGKGAGMGLAFGGASSSVFGGAGASNFFTKVTTWTAVIFMITSLSLAYLGGRTSTSLMKDVAPPAAQSAPAGDGGATTAPTGAAATAETK